MPLRRLLPLALLAPAVRPAAAQSEASYQPGSNATFRPALNVGGDASSGLPALDSSLTFEASPSASLLTWVPVNTTDPLAVCLDGSPAGYYMALTTLSPANPNAYRWLIMLSGYTFCYDAPSCAELARTHPTTTSSTRWPTTLGQGGIFSTGGDSKWGLANRIFVRSCSADLWLADSGPAENAAGLSFRGARILRAVITSLTLDYGMGQHPGENLLIGGCNAGALGAMNALPIVARRLSGQMPVSGFFDSGLLVDVKPAGWPWSDRLEPMQDMVANLVALTSPPIDAACSAKLYLGAAAWKCFFATYRLPLLAGNNFNFFINAPQFAQPELLYDTDGMAPVTPPQLAFVERYQDAVLSLVGALPGRVGILSPSCVISCLSGAGAFATFAVANVTLNEALEDWYTGMTQKFISNCTGWGCTSECGATQDLTPCTAGQLNSKNVSICTTLALPVSSEAAAPRGHDIAIPSDSTSAGPAPAPAPAPRGAGAFLPYLPSTTPGFRARLKGHMAVLGASVLLGISALALLAISLPARPQRRAAEDYPLIERQMRPLSRAV